MVLFLSTTFSPPFDMDLCCNYCFYMMKKSPTLLVQVTMGLVPLKQGIGSSSVNGENMCWESFAPLYGSIWIVLRVYTKKNDEKSICACCLCSYYYVILLKVGFWVVTKFDSWYVLKSQLPQWTLPVRLWNILVWLKRSWGLLTLLLLQKFIRFNSLTKLLICYGLNHFMRDKFVLIFGSIIHAGCRCKPDHNRLLYARDDWLWSVEKNQGIQFSKAYLSCFGHFLFD